MIILVVSRREVEGMVSVKETLKWCSDSPARPDSQINFSDLTTFDQIAVRLREIC